MRVCTISIVMVMLLIASGSGCRLRNNVEEGSVVQHVIGRTSVARSEPMQACQDGTENVDQRDYVRGVLKFIARGNPETFRGPYDVSKFCIQASGDDVFPDAYADARSGVINVAPGMFKGKFAVIENDAHIAAAIAHEAAHITLNHNSLRLPLPEELPRDAPTDDELRRLNAAVNTARSAWWSVADPISGKIIKELGREAPKVIDDFMPSLDAAPTLGRDKDTVAELHAQGVMCRIGLERYWKMNEDAQYSWSGLEGCRRWGQRVRLWFKKIGDPSAPMAALLDRLELLWGRDVAGHAKWQKVESAEAALAERRAVLQQWQEQQADEVGMEFYLRAGFTPTAYIDFMGRLAQIVRSADCRQYVDTNHAPSRVDPAFVGAVHPALCWRYFNLGVNEQQIHRTDFQKISAKPGILWIPELKGQLNHLRGGKDGRP